MTAPHARAPHAGRTARERARASLTADLLAVAGEHIARDGAAGLSLRAVARDLGLASSAVYRYVKSRDELLTLLIIEANREMSDAAEQADRSVAAAGRGAGARWQAVSRAVLAWARDHPHQWGLIYGTPVPGYQAPQDTLAQALRLWRVVVGVVDAAIAAGRLRPAGRTFDVAGVLTPEAEAFIGRAGPPVSDAMVRAVALHTGLVGTVTGVVFGHLNGLSDVPDRMFDLVIATIAAGVGLDLPVPTLVQTAPDAPAGR